MSDRRLRPDTVVRDPMGRFGAGNAGRPRAARDKINQRLEALFARDAEAVVAATIKAARGGDTAAMSLVLNRIFPAAKDRLVVLDLPAAPADAASAIVAAVAAGELLLGDAERLMPLVKAKAELTSLAEIEARITALEGAARRAGSRRRGRAYGRRWAGVSRPVPPTSSISAASPAATAATRRSTHSLPTAFA